MSTSSISYSFPENYISHEGSNELYTHKMFNEPLIPTSNPSPTEASLVTIPPVLSAFTELHLENYLWGGEGWEGINVQFTKLIPYCNSVYNWILKKTHLLRYKFRYRSSI